MVVVVDYQRVLVIQGRAMRYVTFGISRVVSVLSSLAMRIFISYRHERDIGCEGSLNKV